ncbi:MAG: hypothetical protein RMJ84_02485 [Sandaracinaceae bacterium]|nr:hypothetical protein [Sandaracinaceae bacterium]
MSTLLKHLALRLRFDALLLVVGGHLLLTQFSVASAQQRPLTQVLELNRRAMEAYTNLEIDQANSLLQQALQIAQRNGITGSPLARTYLNLAVVAISGMGDNATGLNYMVEAIQADPSIQLDPLTSTPDIQNLFAIARQKAKQGASPQQPASPPPSQPQPPQTAPSPPQPSSTPSQSQGPQRANTPPQQPPIGNLQHVPVPEQLEQTAVPVYIEVPGNPAHVYLYYKAPGMREFQRVEMNRVAQGFGFEIPCTEVLAPEITYYIVAFGADGSPIGFAGSQTTPFRVPIVTKRTQVAPALPGRAPPEPCREQECPPGMPGCKSNREGKKAGEFCTRDSECASKKCRDNLCTASEGEDEQLSGTKPPLFFARLSAFAGLSYVSHGLPADRFPCANRSEYEGSCVEISGFSSLQELPSNWESLTPEERMNQQFTQRAIQFGYLPAGTPNCNPEGNPAKGDPYCFFVETPGFVANFALRLDLGYHVAPFLALTGGARVQPASGQGTLSFMLIYGGLEFQITNPIETGFHLHAHLRGGAGQIQVFLSRANQTPHAPWGRSGLGMVDAGLTLGYRLHRNFGVYLQPTCVLSFPSFLFTIDLGGGLELSL